MQNPYVKKTKKTKETLIMEHAVTVKHIAKRLAVRLPPGIELDDLIQSGMMGLIEAADRYDSSKEIKFKTFAELRIKGAMLDDLRAKDWIPRSVRENSKKLEAAYTNIRADGIDNPSDEQLAKYLEMKPKEFQKFLDQARPIPLLSLDHLAGGFDKDESLNILDVLSDPDAEDQFSQLVSKESKERMFAALGLLPEKEKMVLALYYNEEMNLKEIGAVLNLTESRVSQIRTKAIALVRSYMSEYMQD